MFVRVNIITMIIVRVQSNVVFAARSTKAKWKIGRGKLARIMGGYNILETKALAEYVSDCDFNKSLGYEQRIEQIVDKIFKNYMK